MCVNKDSVSSWVERVGRRSESRFLSRRRREDEYIERKNREIASLEDRVFLFSSKEKKKFVRATVMSHSLELWGFNKNKKGGLYE